MGGSADVAERHKNNPLRAGADGGSISVAPIVLVVGGSEQSRGTPPDVVGNDNIWGKWALEAVVQRGHLTVGDTIRHLRETRTTMSARALSIAVGLSDSYVGKVENSNIEPSFRAFAKIAKGLGMTPPEIYILVGQEAARQ